MIWGICATFIATFMPIWESSDTLFAIGRSLVGMKSASSTGSGESLSDVKQVQMAPTAIRDDDTAHHGNKFNV